MGGPLFVLIALTGVAAILLAYRIGRKAEWLDAQARASVLRHPAVRWEPCGRCDLAWGEPTACGFTGCVDGFVPREADDVA